MVERQLSAQSPSPAHERGDIDVVAEQSMPAQEDAEYSDQAEQRQNWRVRRRERRREFYERLYQESADAYGDESEQHDDAPQDDEAWWDQ